MLLGTISGIEKGGRRWAYIRCQAFRSDVFAHASEILLADVDESLIGKRVSFEMLRTQRGISAANVMVLD